MHGRLTVLALSALLSAPLFAAEPEVVRLWPDKPADSSSEKWIERGTDGVVDRSVGDVSDPTLTVYLPAAAGASTPAVLVSPGGGYSHLAIDKEGHDIAKWLNSIGVAAFVLKYRLPFRDGERRPEGYRASMATRQGSLKMLAVAVEDAEKSMHLIREGAARWRIAPDRIGAMGFSAGGHLSAMLATSADKTVRPDFVALIYPATPQTLEFPAGAPPAFLAHAHDDPAVGPEQSIRYYQATKDAGAVAELHIFMNGGHGFGLQKATGPVGDWPNRFAAWLAAIE